MVLSTAGRRWYAAFVAVFCFGVFKPAWSAEPRSEARAASGVRFTDVSAEAGLAEALKGAYVHGLAWGDFDSDGRVDLFVGNFADRSPKFGMAEAPRNMLFRQNPPGRFERFACPAVETASRCSGAAFADLDNDGDLDLYVTSNTLKVPTKEGSKRPPQLELSRLFRNDGEGRFVDVSAGSGATPATLLRARDAGVLDYDGDGLLDLLVMQDVGVAPNDEVTGLHLFQNLGGLKFKNVAAKVGLPADLWGCGVAIADLNADRRPDFYVCGSNRLYLSRADGRFAEAAHLSKVFQAPEKELDWVTGASFGDLDLDGDLDLATGRHHYHGPSRIHVFLNDGLRGGEPQFHEATHDLGLAPLPQKAPHPEIQDFDNDGILDLYWSSWFADGHNREPFLCLGTGTREGLPRFLIPSTSGIQPVVRDGTVQNIAPDAGRGMVYYVNSPAVDYDGDGDLDLLVGIWPDEPSRLMRNDTSGGNWLAVQVAGSRMNRIGIGSRVAIYRPGMAGKPEGLAGIQELTLNGGYSSSRPAISHFGLGRLAKCDVVVHFPLPAAEKPQILRGIGANQLLKVEEPR
jgi:hypothetical protein